MLFDLICYVLFIILEVGLGYGIWYSGSDSVLLVYMKSKWGYFGRGFDAMCRWLKKGLQYILVGDGHNYPLSLE